MRKLLIAAALLCTASLPSWGAVCTFSTDGLWSGGGSCAGAPTTLDTCVVNASVDVWVDSVSAVCGNLAVSGNVLCAQDSVLTIGDDTGVINDTILVNAGGSIDCPETILIDTDNVNQNGINGVITNNGAFHMRGRLLHAGGRVGSASAISGSYGDPRTLTIADNGLAAVADEYNDKVLVFTSGYHRWQAFDITDTTSTTLVLDADSRGAFDTRNVAGRLAPSSATWAPGDWGNIYDAGTATVASGATTVTFSTAFSSTSEAGETLLGSRFACVADLDAANDPDIRRFCSVTNTTTAELCTTYGTASCAAGATYRVFDDNQPPFAAAIRDQIAAGDGYVIVDQAVLSIPAAKRQSGDTPTDPDHQFAFVANSGSSTIIEIAELGYMGARRDNGAGNVNAVTVNSIDNNDSAEHFILGLYSDMHHFGGAQGITIRDSANITFSKLLVRDAMLEDGTPGGANGHLMEWQDTAAAGRLQNIVVEDARFVRADDDIFTMTVAADAADTILCTGCEIRRVFAGFTPVRKGGSVQGYEPSKRMVGFVIDQSFITNIEGAVVNLNWSGLGATESVSGYVRDSLVQNSQTADCAVSIIDVSAPTSPNDANHKVVWINNVIRNCGGLAAAHRGLYFNNHIEHGNRGMIQGAVKAPQAFRGNTIVGSPRPDVSDSWGLYLNGNLAGMMPAAPLYSDNVLMATTDFASPSTDNTFAFDLGSNTTAISPTLSHNTIVCNDNVTTSAVGSYAVRSQCLTAGSDAQTFRDNLVVDCDKAWGIGSCPDGTRDSDFNLAISMEEASFCQGAGACTSGADDALSGVAGLRSFLNGDGNLMPGATALTKTASDGSIIGARVAGALRSRLLPAYPFLELLPFSNNTGERDSDGDGIFDLFDNCVARMNPSQKDTDGDGIGDACE